MHSIDLEINFSGKNMQRAPSGNAAGKAALAVGAFSLKSLSLRGARPTSAWSHVASRVADAPPQRGKACEGRNPASPVWGPHGRRREPHLHAAGEGAGLRAASRLRDSDPERRSSQILVLSRNVWQSSRFYN